MDENCIPQPACRAKQPEYAQRSMAHVFFLRDFEDSDRSRPALYFGKRMAQGPNPGHTILYQIHRH